MVKNQNKFINSLLIILLLHFSISSILENKPRTIYIIGDSTAANKDTSKGQVERGWGMMFQNCFNK